MRRVLIAASRRALARPAYRLGGAATGGGAPSRAALAAFPRPCLAVAPVPQTASMATGATPPGAGQAAALESSGILVDPYEPDVVKSSLKQRFGYFMVGLAGSTQLGRHSDFKAKDFNKQHGLAIMRRFYELYGAQDLNGLRDITTGPFFAKLKAQIKEAGGGGGAEEKGGGKKGGRNKPARRGRGKQNRARQQRRQQQQQQQQEVVVVAATEEEAGGGAAAAALPGFRLAEVKGSSVVQVRTLKGFKPDEVAFGQVTSEMDLWLVPVDYGRKQQQQQPAGSDGDGDGSAGDVATAMVESDAGAPEVPFGAPFKVSPCPGRWRRAVDDQGQIYFWHTTKGFTQWQRPTEYNKVPDMLPPWEVSNEHYVLTAETERHEDVVVVKQFPIFEISLLGPQRIWKLAGFAN